MAQGMTAAPAPMLPGLNDQLQVRKLIDSFSVSKEGSRIYISRMPNQAERQQLQVANVEMRKALRKCHMATAELERARQYLAALFNGYQQLRTAPADEVNDLLNGYMLVLQQQPLFAIIAAIDEVAGGKVTVALDWPPNSPRMAQLAAKHAGVLAERQYRVDQILAAKHLLRAPDKPGAQNRVAAMLKDFHGRMIGDDTGTISDDEERKRMDARKRQDTRQLILREWKHLGLSPVVGKDGMPMSPALARQLGLLTGPEAAIR